jgi:hypothetical protein
MNGMMLTNAGCKEKRRELDFYPTPPEVTHALMRRFQWPKMQIWEPACGDGSMSEVLKKYGHDVFSSDLRHSGYGSGGVDFLQTYSDCDAIITNPPFCISEEFIRRSLSMSSIVAMVLKCQYWHSQRRSVLFKQHPPAYVLPLTWRPDFANKDGGGSPTMEVTWTVWIDGHTDTRYQLLERPKLTKSC